VGSADGGPWPPSGGVRRLEATVRGRVQGVGYRAFALRAGTELGLDGWVANRPDGGVECVAEGPAEDLEQLLGALRAGPIAAVVDRVETRWFPATGRLDGFVVRSWGHPGD
jgi:acylphosphatase